MSSLLTLMQSLSSLLVLGVEDWQALESLQPQHEAAQDLEEAVPCSSVLHCQVPSLQCSHEPVSLSGRGHLHGNLSKCILTCVPLIVPLYAPSAVTLTSFSPPLYISPLPFLLSPSRLPSIEKFSRFSRLLEMNINTMHMACGGLNVAQRDMVVSVNLLAKDLKCFAKGMQPSTGGRKYLYM